MEGPKTLFPPSTEIIFRQCLIAVYNYTNFGQTLNKKVECSITYLLFAFYLFLFLPNVLGKSRVKIGSLFALYFFI